MKNSIYILLMAAGISTTHPAISNNIKREAARVSKATVYLRGAQLTCTSEFSAIPGINEFIFEGVSSVMDVSSLQASAKGDITIMDVKYQMQLNESPVNVTNSLTGKQLKSAGDSLVMLNFEIEELNEQLQSLATEKNIILNNRLIKGESNRDTLEMFKEAINFLRSRLNNISTESTRLKKRLFYGNENKTALQNRINELSRIAQSGVNPPKESLPVVVVMAYSEIATAARVSISFYVDRAAWVPVYDLRANTNGKIDLNYKAEISQQTGMDWKNVDLTLSTGNPALNTQIPVLHPFYLSFVQHHRKKFNQETLSLQGVSKAAAAVTREEANKDEMMLDARTMADFTNPREGMIQTEYDIKIRYNIPNDDGMHIVTIQNKALNADYKHSSIPKLDMNAYLIAELDDLDELNLIAGNSRIYFDGNFIGKSVLNPDAFTDTVKLSLGKDRGIVVNRKKLKDKTKERILADEKTVSVTYEITIRNTKSSSVTLDLYDQIPVSSDPNIKVSLINGDGSELTDESGMLSWKMNLKSMESKKLRFSYEVKMPKSAHLAGL
jgi:uncharacterized protein (TIGR02231 family)